MCIIAILILLYIYSIKSIYIHIKYADITMYTNVYTYYTMLYYYKYINAILMIMYSLYILYINS